MKALVITALFIVFSVQAAESRQVSNSHEGDEKPIRIIREIR